MNLTWHLIKKDLRQFRLAAIAWGAFVVTQIAFHESLFSGRVADSNWFLTMAMILNLLVFLGALGAYCFGGVLVLSDAPAGSGGFWKTRPISGWRQLGAKLVSGLLLLGVLPVLLWLPWWIWSGFDASGICRAVVNVLTLNLLAGLVGATLAAVVDEVGRFALVTLVLLAALVVVLLNLIPLQLSTHLGVSRLILALGCVLLTGGVVLAWQYRTRKTLPATGMLLAGVAVTLLVGFASPVNFYSRAGKSLPPLAATSAVSGRITGATLEGRTVDGVEQQYMTVFATMSGMPEDLFVESGDGTVELRWPDGTVARSDEVRFPSESMIGNAEVPLRRALDLDPKRGQWPDHWDEETRKKQESAKAESERRRASSPRPHVSWPKDASTRMMARFPVSATIAAKIRATPPECHLIGRFQADRPVILGQVAFVPTNRINNQGRFELLQFARTLRTQMKPPLDPVFYLGVLVTAEPPRAPRNRNFYVLHRQNGIIGRLYTNRLQATAPLATKLTCHLFDFQPPTLWRTDRWVEEPEWLKQASLVEVTSEPVGQFEQTLTTPRLAMLGEDNDQPGN